jgi:hypothetical protein
MATSKIAIMNSALGRLGESAISASDENNKRARVMGLFYDETRRDLLRSYVWHFARERISLAPDATAPAFGYTNRFLLPSRVLRVVGMYDESDPSYQHNYTGTEYPFKVEGRYVLSDLNPLRLHIIRDEEDTTKFDPCFDVSLAWLLAATAATSLTDDKGLVDICTKGYQMSLKNARTSNAMEGTPETIMSTTWLDARRTYGTAGPYRIGPVW